MKALTKVALLINVIALAFLPATLRSGNPGPCTDVTMVDFANITIHVPEYGQVKLKDGKGYTPRVSIDGKDYGSDWEVQIKDNMVFKPAAESTLGLINIEVNHLTGSGAWGYVLIYTCSDGQLHRVFQSLRHLYGNAVERLSENAFTIGYPVWNKSDAMCCPSMQGRETYVWVPSEQRFKKTKEVLAPMSNR